MLGSSEEKYDSNTLSKFGLGLKSAAFSQGQELQLISSSDGHDFNKYILSLTKITEQKKYFATKHDLDEEDKKLISNYLASQPGTIVKISNIRMNNHPSVRMTVEELTKKLGTIYYFFMKDEDLKISLEYSSEKNEIEPFDVLQVTEADENGNLDENTWDGTTVTWIEKIKEITLDANANVKAKIAVTQLPYPPIFEIEQQGKQKLVREKYNIESGNYGFYVYRNKRLISWAESFDGIIPQDQELYAFRGLILIDESADESFNIDVKKSTITLSDEARNEINDRADQYKRKSRKAWRHANSLRKEKLGADPNSTANNIIANFNPPDFLPGEAIATEFIERERNNRQQEIEEEMRSKVREIALKNKKDSSIIDSNQNQLEEIEESDIETAISGNSNPEQNKIFRVESVEDNILWEPYYDADHGCCVRINKGHRFARLVFEDNIENSDLQIIYELFLLQLATAEVYIQKQKTAYPKEQIKELSCDYRRITSEFLASMCRDIGENLPPLGNL
jgi:Histidine kinase-, DNA gyrase B-, and HSP90-like ATPase